MSTVIEFACTFLMGYSKFLFVRSLNIPLYLYFDRLIVNTIVLDRNDFIEETCILRCHLNSHPEGFFGFRRSFTAILCMGLPKTTTLLFLSSRNVWKVISAGNLFKLFNRSSKSIQMGWSKPLHFSM